MRRYDWRPYVSVAARRRQARREMEKLRKRGLDVQPVTIEGRKIARSFWGGAWCTHLEKFSDYANRLPRGRTYVRNGSVCHLEVATGHVRAMVSGSEIYNVTVDVEPLPSKKWRDVKKSCTGRIGSLLELLQGKLSDGVMQVVTDRDRGLFPRPMEIRFECDCPDWATMCKHVAAVFYGVGARLDERPELLFLLRGVDHEELIAVETEEAVAALGARSGHKRIARDDLQEVFGLDLAGEEPDLAPTAVRASKRQGRRKKKKGRSKARPAGQSRDRSGVRTVRVVRKVSPRTGPTMRKTGAPKKSTAKGNRRPSPQAARVKSSPRAITGKTVARLRARFGMSQSRFSQLLGVSPSTVGNWEKIQGRLRLQPRTLAAWEDVSGLKKSDAWKRLAGA